MRNKLLATSGFASLTNTSCNLIAQEGENAMCKLCGGRLVVERDVSPFCYIGYCRCEKCGVVGFFKDLKKEN